MNQHPDINVDIFRSDETVPDPNEALRAAGQKAHNLLVTWRLRQGSRQPTDPLDSQPDNAGVAIRSASASQAEITAPTDGGGRIIYSFTYDPQTTMGDLQYQQLSAEGEPQEPQTTDPLAHYDSFSRILFERSRPPQAAG